uniref:Uncharacterized protein n=1 Tax=Candidatus Kentrum sp. MB TaxID=2138164 RepID=A0A450XTP3_9GAMM|nr:MAG: hypothetical protein BECKMB1821G_GA0114241_11192 [Candidatus Kentron sp. MB]VFK35347.1 MAG: hypothetical protein BECKMB1821I_GA0114274_11135 [Candidatus Kentron sp. MB]VFK77237.1 MAG: hypothetical protein BECKMB1821H_GA0114242_11135 [Candidatus Kentron sp. MB]
MNVYLFQSSGDLGRLDIIRQLLREKGVPYMSLTRDTPLEEPYTLVFCHSSDCDNEFDEKVEKAASEGTLVVYYSGGFAREEEMQEPTGKGTILYLAWSTVPELLRRLPNGFKREDITATWREMRRCDLINAVAILCRAVTAETRRRSVKEVQEDWRSDREKWRKVFPGYNRDDFLESCDRLLFGKNADDIPEVRKIIEWMTRKDAPKPSFDVALDQMKAKFSFVM